MSFGGQCFDDAGDRGYGGRIADQEISGGRLVGHLECGGAVDHRLHSVTGPGAFGPGRTWPGGFMQDEVDVELAGAPIGVRDGVAALVLVTSFTGEPEAQPGSGPGVQIVERVGEVIRTWTKWGANTFLSTTVRAWSFAPRPRMMAPETPRLAMAVPLHTHDLLRCLGYTKQSFFVSAGAGSRPQAQSSRATPRRLASRASFSSSSIGTAT